MVLIKSLVDMVKFGFISSDDLVSVVKSVSLSSSGCLRRES